MHALNVTFATKGASPGRAVRVVRGKLGPAGGV